MFSMASYVYTGYEKLRQYAIAGETRSKSVRSKSARERRNSWDRLQEFQNKYGKQKRRARSKRYREESDNLTSEQQRTDSSFNELDFRTAYGRSQSRARSRMRSRSRLPLNQDLSNEGGTKIQTETVEQAAQEEAETKSIGVQADSFVNVTRKKVKKVTKKTEISRHSIGVGSICVDQTHITLVQEKT